MCSREYFEKRREKDPSEVIILEEDSLESSYVEYLCGCSCHTDKKYNLSFFNYCDDCYNCYND